jgi:hypothetical protein
MTATRRKYLVRRLVASTVVAVLIGVGLARAFAGGSSSAPADDAAAFVPSDALVYLNLDTSKNSPQWKHTAQAIGKLPLAGQLRDALLTAATSDGLGRLRLDRDIEPWLGSEAAYAELPGGRQNLLLFRVRDQRAALRSFEAGGGDSSTTIYRGTALHDVGDGSVAALSGGWALIGAPDAVRAGLDTRARPVASLGNNAAYLGLERGLPGDRVGNAWLSGQWLDAHLAGPAALLAGAARAPGIQSAAVGFGDDGRVMRLAFRGRSAPAAAAAPGCGGPGAQGDGLISQAPARPALFVGLAGAGCILRDLMSSPGSTLGRALQRLSARAARAGVSLDRDVLPLLGKGSALSLTQGPTITLEATGVPAQQSLNTVGRLVPAIVKLLDPESGGSTPNFAAERVNGVPVLTAGITPALSLSYAAFRGNLVMSNSARAIGSPKGAQHLDQSKDFRTVLGDRPKAASALVFLDLTKLLALADQAGLGSNPTYAAVRDDLQKIGAAGAVLSREGNDIDAELRLKNP